MIAYHAQIQIFYMMINAYQDALMDISLMLIINANIVIHHVLHAMELIVTLVILVLIHLYYSKDNVLEIALMEDIYTINNASYVILIA